MSILLPYGGRRWHEVPDEGEIIDEHSSSFINFQIQIKIRQESVQIHTQYL